MKVIVDESTCVGAGQCVVAAPAVFDQRADDGIAFLLDSDPPDELLPQINDAAARCPALAIEVVE